jgi:hypothetical protein
MAVITFERGVELVSAQLGVATEHARKCVKAALDAGELLWTVDPALFEQRFSALKRIQARQEAQGFGARPTVPLFDPMARARALIGEAAPPEQPADPLERLAEAYADEELRRTLRAQWPLDDTLFDEDTFRQWLKQQSAPSGRGGRHSDERKRVESLMRQELAAGKLTREELDGMKQEAVGQRYGAATTTARRARIKVLNSDV